MDRVFEIKQRIQEINWFHNCGNPINEDVEFELVYVNSIEEAVQSCSNDKWEETTLEARNILTSYLFLNYRKEYNNWNEFTNANKLFLEREVVPVMSQYQKVYDLSNVFIDCVKWDIMGALMEFDYQYSGAIPRFFEKLLRIYECGNFPCGWIGEFPNGSLVVY